VAERIQLGELAARGSLLVNDGYRTRADELGLPGIPVLRVAEVQDGRLTPTFGDHVLERYRAKIGGKVSQPGDVVVTTKGTVGRTARVPAGSPDFVYSPQVCFFRSLDDTVDCRWLYYWFKGPEFIAQAAGVQSQTDMAAYINLADMRAMRMSLPAPDQQRAIAATLGAMDDKIESNRQIIEIAHKLAAAHCQSILGRDGHSWTESWPTCRLEAVLAELEVGKRPIGGIKNEEDGIPSIGAESIVEAGSFNFSKTKLIPTPYFAAMARGRIKHLDVLLYKDGGTPGNFVPHVSAVGHGFPFSIAAINEHVYRIRVTQPYTQAFLYFWFSSPRMDIEMRQRGTGAAIPGLNSSAVRDLPLLQPPEHLLTKIQGLLDPLLDLILQSAKVSRRSSQLRDALLPELLSGRIGGLEVSPAVDPALVGRTACGRSAVS